MSPEIMLKSKIEELQSLVVSMVPQDATEEKKQELEETINNKLSALFLNDLLALCDRKLQEQGRGRDFENLMNELGQIGRLGMKDMLADPQENFKQIFESFSLDITQEEVIVIYIKSCDAIINSLKS